MTDPIKPRLLVLSSTFPRWHGDTEPPFVYELSRRLTSRFSVTVLAPRAPGSLEEESMDDVRMLRFPYFFPPWEQLATHGSGILSRLKANPLNYLLVPPFLLGQLRILTRLLRREHFQLIHAHWLVLQGLLAAIALGLTHRAVPLVCTSHGGDLYGLRGSTFEWLQRRIVERSTKVTVVSAAMRDTLLTLGAPSHKIEVIPMGVDLRERFTPDIQTRRKAHELLFVGRLVEKKGLRALLEALPSVAARHPGVRLTVVGDGPLGAELRCLAKTLGVDTRVDFLGMVGQPELPTLYRRATLCVAPFVVAVGGDQEGLGLVPVEAMGCGCPVVASDLPAVSDVITDGRTGVLVPKGNPEALAVAISAMLSDPNHRETLASAGLAHCRQSFDWPRIVARYAALLEASCG